MTPSYETVVVIIGFDVGIVGKLNYCVVEWFACFNCFVCLFGQAIFKLETAIFFNFSNFFYAENVLSDSDEEKYQVYKTDYQKNDAVVLKRNVSKVR